MRSSFASYGFLENEYQPDAKFKGVTFAACEVVKHGWRYARNCKCHKQFYLLRNFIAVLLVGTQQPLYTKQ